MGEGLFGCGLPLDEASFGRALAAGVSGVFLALACAFVLNGADGQPQRPTAAFSLGKCPRIVRDFA
mgnify:CR=1 FL=1